MGRAARVNPDGVQLGQRLAELLDLEASIGPPPRQDDGPTGLGAGLWSRLSIPRQLSAALVTMPVGMIGLPHHALRQFKEPILMPPSHGRVAQPSYLGREPSHVMGQLL